MKILPKISHKLSPKEHKYLETYCKQECTRKLGWNKEKRFQCRENTMCQDCFALKRYNLPEESRLIGVRPFNKNHKPEEGQKVIWFWSEAGLLCSGDFYKEKPRDATGFELTKPPTNWMPFPKKFP